MIMFLARKMWRNKWLMICLLIGNILLVGVVSATPLYTQATMQRIFQQDLRQLQQDRNQHPTIINLTYSFNRLIEPQRMPYFLQTRDEIVPELAAVFDVPIVYTFESHSMVDWSLTPEGRGIRVLMRNVSLSGTDMFDQVRIIAGRLPSESLVVGPDGYIIEAIATEAAFVHNNMLLDEVMYAERVDSDRAPFHVKIVGIYEPACDSHLYWTSLRRNTLSTILISNDIVRDSFVEMNHPDYRVISRWLHLLDYNALRARYLDNYLYMIDSFDESLNALRGPWSVSFNFTSELASHRARTAPLYTMLWVLQVPMYVLLAFYIYMVSRQILLLEQNEIAVLSSRGVSRKRIIGVYALQGLFIAIISIPAGVALGVVLCQLLGASSGFLYLVRRAALVVEVTPVVYVYAAAAMSLSFLTMFLPVIGFSKVNIVAHKQKKRGHILGKSLWQRFFLDILCFAVALYGLYSFNRQREIMALLDREAPAIDPLLLLSSSLFIIGAGLFALRLFPLLVRLVYRLGERFWSPQTYAAIIRVVRSAGEEQFIMIFLVLTMAVGIFSAYAARTINTNNEHRLQYLNGADVTFLEVWQNNLPQLPQFMIDELGLHVPDQVVYTEPSFERFANFPEVDALTRVQRHLVDITVRGSRVDDVALMGIETNTFGETVWFRDDLLRIHINYFLNTLARNPRGVLLSNNFRTYLGYDIGDVITMRYEYRRNPSIVFMARLEVVGFVDYWPGYARVQSTRLATGEIVQADQFLAVANLGHLQTVWGMLPYEVWMRTNTDNNRFIYDFQAEHGLDFTRFSDIGAAIVESRLDPIVQGTNGVLTMGFIVTLLICFTGFMIYWVLSIRARVLQFGIYRAMGMSVRSIFRLLINEQLLITFMAIVIGAVVGEIAARLYVPLIQVSYTAAAQVIPLMVITQMRDYINLYSVIGVMMVACLVVLGLYVKRIKIAQALMLGED